MNVYVLSHRISSFVSISKLAKHSPACTNQALQFKVSSFCISLIMSCFCIVPSNSCYSSACEGREAHLGPDIQGHVHDNWRHRSVMVGTDGVGILADLVHDDILHRGPIALELHADGAGGHMLLAVGHDHTLLHGFHVQVRGLEGPQQV